MINPYVVIVCLLMMGSESGDLLERVQIFSELEGLKKGLRHFQAEGAV